MKTQHTFKPTFSESYFFLGWCIVKLLLQISFILTGSEVSKAARSISLVLSLTAELALINKIQSDKAYFALPYIP